jgi:ribose 5-phosphate isomerase A
MNRRETNRELEPVSEVGSEIWPAAAEAAAMVRPGTVVGLGTGRAASMFVRALARRIRAREVHEVRGVPTSVKTEALARELSIPLVSLENLEKVDLAVDGADEVSPSLDLVKGRGGALLRERIVATFSSRFVVVVGEEKLVPRLGSRVPLPVEVFPFGVRVATLALERMGGRVDLRLEGDVPYRTDNGNAVLNVDFGGITHPERLERSIDAVPGVVDSGLFVGMADLVLVQTPAGVRRLERQPQ